MPKINNQRPLHRHDSVVVPFKFVPPEIDMSRPLTDFAIDYIAEQLVAGYGDDALPLAARRATEVYDAGDADKYANWCLVVSTLEDMARGNPSTKRQGT